MVGIQQIENKRAELLKRMNENIVKIKELEEENRTLSKSILKLQSEEDRIEKEELIKEFTEKAKRYLPKDYTIYKAILETDYIGTEQIEIILWDNSENIIELEDILSARAKENVLSYGYTLEEDLPMLCEDYGYNDEDELIDQLGLEISGYGYYYEEVKLNDLDVYEIKNLIDQLVGGK